MNHLAHLWLVDARSAPPSPLLRLGSLLGDFARGLDLQALPAEVRAGIDHHRAVDRFTDAHASFRQSRRRVSPPLQRHAGVLVDVFYDHFLARDWQRLGDGRPLRAFTQEVYAVVSAHQQWLPPRLRAALPQMIERDWLSLCAGLPGVTAVLQRLALRLRRPVPLAAGVHDLVRDYDGFAADFAAFCPEVRAFAATALLQRPSYSDAIGRVRGPSSSQTANGDG